MQRISSFRDPWPRYPTLRIIGFLFTLTGAILVAIGVSLMVFGLYTVAIGSDPDVFPPPLTPRPGPQSAVAQWIMAGGLLLLWSLAILVSGVQMIGVGAFLRLMIHVEENTRASAQALDAIRSRQDAGPRGVGPRFES